MTGGLVSGASAFPRVTWADAVDRAQGHPPFLVDGLICTTTTVVYGAPNQGKTRLVASLAVAANNGSAQWLGRAFNRPVSSIVICTADAGSQEQYVTLIREALPDGQRPKVTFRSLGSMQGPEVWADLYESVMLDQPDLVVIDPLTRIVAGSLNEDVAINAVFDGIKPFEQDNIPVVIVAHSSPKMYGGQRQHGPAGSFAIEANGRWFISLYQEGNGDLNLRCYGNHALTHKLILRPGQTGSTFEVVDTTDGEALLAAAGRGKAKRAKDTYDGNMRAAQIVVSSCQGMTEVKAIAEVVVEQMGGRWQASTMQKKLAPSGPVHPLLSHDGKGTWTLKDLVRSAEIASGAAGA